MPIQRPDSPSPGSKRSPSLSPPPGSSSEIEADKRSASVGTSKQPREQKGNGNGNGNSSSKYKEGKAKAIPVVDDEDNEDDEGVKNDEKAGVQAGLKMKAAKARHQADLVKHAYEPPKADRPQDDWQVAYVWAFIAKFNQREKIRKLECLEDFEAALVEPIANQPDDILEGILVRFMSNLKPGNRNINSSNVQKLLTQYIDDHLSTSTEFTVWDRPWAPNEEARGACCITASDRLELGRLRYPGEPASERLERNPMKKIMDRGGGVFELDWWERVKILRQLVDWQLTDCEQIRAIINQQNHLGTKGVKAPEIDKVAIEPLGMDRDKQRIWALDNSGRLYRSGNPFKRPCPLVALSSNGKEFADRVEEWKTHGESQPPKPSGSGSSGKKPSKQEQAAIIKATKGIKLERELAEKAGEMVEAVDKEEQRILRARKRAAETQRFAAQAEFRSTRTRRTGRKVDYTYDGFDDDDIAPRRSGRNSGAYEPAQTSSRAIIPGERQSARQAAKAAREAEEVAEANGASDDDDDDDEGDSDGAGGSRTNGHTNGNGKGHAGSSSESGNGDDPNGDALSQIDLDEEDGSRRGHAKKRRTGKGWEWIEEEVEEQDMTADEKERYKRALEKRAEKKKQEAVDVDAHDGGDGDDAMEID